MRILKSERSPLWVAVAISICVHLLLLPSLKVFKLHKAAPEVMTAILQPLPPLKEKPQVQAKLEPHAVRPEPLKKKGAPPGDRSKPVKKASPKEAAPKGRGRTGRPHLSRSVMTASPAPQLNPSSTEDAGAKDTPDHSTEAVPSTDATPTENGSDHTDKDVSAVKGADTEKSDEKKSSDDTSQARHVLPGHVRIDYQIQTKGYVAHAKQEWRVTDGLYHISLQGSLRLLFIQLGGMTMSSDGHLARGIPEPDRSVEDRNGHVTMATFMADGGVTINQEGHQRTLKPASRPVDLMSLAYGLAAQPSVATGTVFTLVNRNDAEELRLDTVNAGQTTVAGQTFAVQRYVLDRQQSAGGIEIWLAPDLDEVPVKVIIRGRDGELTMAAERIGINEPSSDPHPQ